MDATLFEISEIVRRQNEQARGKDLELAYSFIFPDFNGNYKRKEVGTVF